MGHQLARAAAAATLIVLPLACGGGDDASEPTSVLDNARAAVEAAEEAPDGSGDDGDTADGAVAPSTDDEQITEPEDDISVDELPPPDPSEFEGANRVVNLWVGPAGETRSIDVWGRRTFTNGPILLADDVGFGEASDYFGAPLGYSLVVVGSGAGPDGAELAGLFNATDGEQITTIFTNDDDQGAVWAPNLWERDPNERPGVPAPPEPGMGFVYLYAANTFAFDDALTAAIGSDSYYVGDGSGECRRQRVEDLGFQASVLGGTQSVELDLPPGPATITLHPWFSPDECRQPPAFEFVVDVPVDGSVMALVYSSDGTSLATLQIPIGP